MEEQNHYESPKEKEASERPNISKTSRVLTNLVLAILFLPSTLILGGLTCALTAKTLMTNPTNSLSHDALFGTSFLVGLVTMAIVGGIFLFLFIRVNKMPRDNSKQPPTKPGR